MTNESGPSPAARQFPRKRFAGRHRFIIDAPRKRTGTEADLQKRLLLFPSDRTMKTTTILIALALAGPVAAEAPDFAKDIAPILEASCVKCHNSTKAKGKLNMQTKEGALKGSEDGKLFEAGKADDSALIKVLLLPEDDDDAMPPKDKAPRPTKEQVEKLKEWINAGANWPDGVELKVPAK